MLRKFYHDEKAKKYLSDIDYLNYRLFEYATCTQKMSRAAFELEIRREFRTSTSLILDAYDYLRGIKFYDVLYKEAIKCKKDNPKLPQTY